jgi:hypothetical protein
VEFLNQLRGRLPEKPYGKTTTRERLESLVGKSVNFAHTFLSLAGAGCYAAFGDNKGRSPLSGCLECLGGWLETEFRRKCVPKRSLGTSKTSQCSLSAMDAMDAMDALSPLPAFAMLLKEL